MNYSGKFDAKAFAEGLSQHQPGHLYSHSVHASHAPSDAIIVSDANLLFHGDFKRAGVDLVLSSDGREVVLHDYFKGEKHAPLASPDGAHLSGDLVSALAGSVEYAQADGNAAANQVIGHVTKLVGTATAIRNGVSIILNNGDNVEKGDVVQSGQDSTLGITFIDGTVFGLLSNARMVLNEMVYDPNGSNNSSLLSLVAGTITFVAGETAKHGDMKVDTPVATMGIRGTAVLVEIDFTVPGTTPDARFQVLVEPDGSTGSYILFDKTTLTPLAVVDQAGVQINISNGILSQTTNPLSPEIQKLIQDVFSLKFSDNSNTKSIQHFTDIIVPTSLGSTNFSNVTGTITIPVVITTANANNSTTNTATSIGHISQAPTADATNGIIIAQPGGTTPATVSGTIAFADINLFDKPTVTASFDSLTLKNAQGQDITATLSEQQKMGVEAALTLVPNPGNNNKGVDTWTYSVPASALGFLAQGDTLTLTYNAIVDNNFTKADQTATVPVTITIKVGGEIWTETKEIPSPAPGDWNNGANWSSGVAPTAADDVVISTSGQQNGTPFYPVTIKSTEDGGVAAFADSVTMDDLGNIAPELDNYNTLTIGSGGLHLNADSILKNFGTISIGGIAEILQSSVLQNSGLMTFAQGGEFGDSSHIANSGTIEVAGGTLNVEVNIDNGGGTLQVDSGAKLMVADGATITKGALTLAASSILDVEGAAGATLDGVTVTGTSGILPSAIEIGATTDSGSILTLDDGTTITNGDMTIAGGSTLDVEGAGGATLDGVTVIAAATGAIEIGATTDSGSILTLDDGTTITSGDMTIAGGSTLDVEGAGGATLDGVSVSGVSGTSGSTIEIGAHTASGSILTLDDGTLIKNGNLTIAAGSTLDVERVGGATLDGVTVIGTSGDTPSTIDIGVHTASGSILTLDDGTTITNGDMTIAGASTLDIESAGGATLNGVTVIAAATAAIDIGTNTDGGSILKLDDGTTITDGNLTIAGGSTLDVESAGGATLDDVNVTSGDALSTIEIGVDTASGSILTLDDGTLIKNGNLTIAAGSTLDIESSAGATLDGVNVTATDGTIEIGVHTASGSILTLDHGTTITNVDMTIAGLSTLDIEGSTLDHVAVTGTSGPSASTININGAVTLEGETTINGGVMSIAKTATLDIENPVTGTGATLDGVDVNNSGTIQVDSPGPGDTTITLLLDDGTKVTGGTLLIHVGFPNNTVEGVVEIGAGGATFDDVNVINNNELIIDSLATLTLNGTTIDGGTIDDTGTLSVMASSEIEHATVDGGAITVASGQTLTLDAVTLDGVTLSGSFSNASTLTIDGTVALNGVTLDGGIVDNSGTVDVTADSSINNAFSVVNSGTVQADGAELDLVGTTVNNANGTFTTIGSGLLGLKNATINGGTLAGRITTIAGNTGSLLDGITLAFGALVTAAVGVLELTGTIFSNGEIDANSGGTLDLDNVNLIGGTLGGNGTIVTASDNVSSSLIGGDIASGTVVTASAGVLDLAGTIFNNGEFDAASTGQLHLDNAVIIGGTLGGVGPISTDGSNSTSLLGNVTIASGTKLSVSSGVLELTGTINNHGEIDVTTGVLDLNNATVIGGTIDDIGTLLVTAPSEIENATVDGGGAITVASGQTLTLDAVTLDGVTLSGNFSNSGTLTIDDTVKLNGATINGGTIDDTGTLLVIAPSEIENATVDGGGALTVASGELDLVGTTVNNTSGTITTIGSGLLGLKNATINGGTLAGRISTIAGNTGSLLDGITLAFGALVTAAVGVLELTGTIFSNGEIDANSGGTLDLDNVNLIGGTLGGNGTIVTAGDNVSSSLIGGVIASGTVVTASAGVLDLAGTIFNNGEFDAASTGQLHLDNAVIIGGTLGGVGPISTDGSNSSSLLGNVTIASGTKLSVSSGVLELTGTINNHGEIDVTTGVLDLNNATVIGGTLSGGGTIATASALNTLDGVTIAGGTTVSVTDGTSLDLVATISDGGTIALDSLGHATELEISGSVSLVGGGDVTMSDNTQNSIVSDGSAAMLTNSDTISGAGTIGDVYLTLVNDGTIDATGTHSLIIDTGTNSLTSTGSLVGNISVTNDGTLEASAGSTLLIEDNITTDAASTGNIEIFNNATVEITGSVSTGQAVTFGAPGGTVATHGLLVLDDSHGFQGTIAGLVENSNESQENQVDLRDLQWQQGQMSVKFTELDEQSGQVKISSGSDSVTLKVLGDFSDGSFEISSDGHSGTLVADPPVAGNVTINSDQVLDIFTASSATISFTNNNGNAGELLLNDSKGFTGTITGFAGDGTIANSDLIDVTDVNFAQVALSKTTYTDDGNGMGTLALHNANGQVLDSINFAGNYQLANFTIENDGNGGTLIVDPPVNSIGQPATSTVVASGPNQTLSGSAPNDNFVFNFSGVGHTGVADFNPATDTLQFNSSIFESVQAALNAAHEDGHGNTVIAIDAHDSITLSGVLKAQLHASDFHIA